jgi:DNA repair protein RadC
MRDKLLLHGARIFDTYELLEMLLYLAIPFRDTNPTSKRLLARFGSLEGVLSASCDELVQIEGIGDSAASLIQIAGEYRELLKLRCDTPGALMFDDYHFAGRYLVNFFDENREENLAFLLLDNSMRLLKIETVPCENFGSAIVRPKVFLDAVARTGAGNVIIACNHKYGSLYFSN